MPSPTVAQYTAGARGWVQERFLRQRRYLPQLTVGAEAANAIPVTIAMTTFQEALNDYVAADEVLTLEVVLLDNNGLQEVVGSYTMAETGTGTEVSATAQPRLIIQTDASGAAQVTVTDVSAVSTETLHLLVRPLNVPGFDGYVAITFA